MADFEKNRAEYVMHLERQVEHLQRQLTDLQSQEKWIPRINTVMNSSDETVRITMAVGGKRVTVTLTYEFLRGTDLTSATSAALDSFNLNLFSDRFRLVVEPEIDKAMKAAKAIEGAGKW